jgi:hypothetical protein
MNINYYNNIGAGIVALGSVLNITKTMQLSKAFLIFPLISHKSLLQHLARSTTEVVSIEKLIVDKTSFFANFNERYLASLTTSINALQYLTDMKYVTIDDGRINLVRDFEYDQEMGSRAKKIFISSKNISIILSEETTTLYTNFRVQL